MIRTILCAVFLLVAFSFTTYAQEPPSRIILHNNRASSHAIPRDPFTSYVKTKKTIDIFLYPNEDSEIVGVLYAGESAKVLGMEKSFDAREEKVIVVQGIPSWRNWTAAQHNPGKPLPRPGDYIYLISPTENGDLYAFFDGYIITVPMEGIKNFRLKGTREIKNTWDLYVGNKNVWGEYLGYKGKVSALDGERWICIMLNNGLEGWVRDDSNKDWYTSRGNIFLGQQEL